jgi:IS5 family transposase
MKAHIAVDADSGAGAHSHHKAANEADIEEIADLLHGKEHHV